MNDELMILRNSTEMNRKEFAEYFGIPYRTLQDWELGNRPIPDYLFRLLAYYVRLNAEQMKTGKKDPELT